MNMQTEKQKMLAGELYYPAHCRQLDGERNAAQDNCYHFNQLPPSQSRQRLTILQNLLKHVGENTTIMPGFWCDYGYNITLGDNFFANFNCIMLDAAPIQFGHHVFIGPNCSFYTSGHPVETAMRAQGAEYAYPITVGNHVWFGGNVVVLPGVTIGNNCVIAAGSVVTRSVPDNVIAMGNPCRIKQKLD